MKRLNPFMAAVTALGLLFVSSCKTKSDVRREQEYERIKAEVREARGARADLEVISEEFRAELARLSAAVEDLGHLQRTQNEEFRRDLQAVNVRIQAVEQQAASTPPPKPTRPVSFDAARAVYDEGQFEEAIELAKQVIRSKPKQSADARRAQFLLGEAYFGAKDYGAAALAFSEYKKEFPKSANVANATLRQAQCFKLLGKDREATLFYQEVLDRYPKSNAAAQARKEMRKK